MRVCTDNVTICETYRITTLDVVRAPCRVFVGKWRHRGEVEIKSHLLLAFASPHSTPSLLVANATGHTIWRWALSRISNASSR